MNEVAYNVSINILAAVIIAIIGFVLRPLQNYFAIKKKQGLVGEWYIATVPNSPNMKEIIIQRVLIEHRIKITEMFQRNFGLLDVTLVECVEGYEWKAKASISMGRFLVGEWWSTKRGAPQRGTFTLVVSSQGGMLYGYFSGLNDLEKTVMKKSVLGKTKDDLIHGFTLLREHRFSCNWDQHPFFVD